SKASSYSRVPRARIGSGHSLFSQAQSKGLLGAISAHRRRFSWNRESRRLAQPLLVRRAQEAVMTSRFSLVAVAGVFLGITAAVARPAVAEPIVVTSGSAGI